MPRYVAKPKLWWGDDAWDGFGDEPEKPLVDDIREPKFSGLYDANGQPLYRLPETVGFDVRRKPS